MAAQDGPCLKGSECVGFFAGLGGQQAAKSLEMGPSSAGNCPETCRGLRNPSGVEAAGWWPPKGARGPLKAPRGPFKGPRGPLKGHRGPLKGPRGPLKGPRDPLKGPRGPLKGPRGPFLSFSYMIF